MKAGSGMLKVGREKGSQMCFAMWQVPDIWREGWS